MVVRIEKLASSILHHDITEHLGFNVGDLNPSNLLSLILKHTRLVFFREKSVTNQLWVILYNAGMPMGSAYLEVWKGNVKKT